MRAVIATVPGAAVVLTAQPDQAHPPAEPGDLPPPPARNRER